MTSRRCPPADRARPPGLRPSARARSAGRRRSPVAELAALFGLLVYLLPLCAAIGHPHLGGGADRAPSVVVARQRQAPDAATDDRPCPRPAGPALSAPCVATGLVHGGPGALVADRAPVARARRAPSPGPARAPPIL